MSQINRINTASDSELLTLETLTGIIKSHLKSQKVTAIDLKGTGRAAKFQFVFGDNSKKVWAIEFLMSDQEVRAIRLVTSRDTTNSKFYKNLLKIEGSKSSYGGVVVHIPANNMALDILSKIEDGLKSPEMVELSETRTYYDPPKDWITGREGTPPPKKEAPVDTPETKEDEK